MSSEISQSMVMNQNLLEDQDILLTSSQLGININFPNFHTNFTSLFPQLPLKTLATITPSIAAHHDYLPLMMGTLSDNNHSISTKQREEDFTALFADSQILSLQNSTPNYWACGELSDCMSTRRRSRGDNNNDIDEHLRVKMKKVYKGGGRRLREPRFCFKTMSDVDVLDDGYKWRKYGQKLVKETLHPRSYYRCTQDNCRVKKRVERLAEDPRMVITTYEGRHIHSPSRDHHDQDDSQSSDQLYNFFW